MKKEKTMHELVKEFPDKSYRELEKYRDADRQQEAKQIPLTESQKIQEELEPIGMGHNHPPDEGEEQDNPTLWEIAKEHKISYADAVPIQEDMRLKRDALKAACTLGEMRKHRTPLTNMKKRAEEAEGELSIMKGIETNRVKEAQARCDHLQSELDRVKKENNDLFNRVADALAVNESHQKMNGKLQERLTELEEENKRMHEHLNKPVNNARKSGM
jgi:hypothetical protein|tara:strand:+ start:666 stop:1313 length:648 start_codon:yes stop_codon:yes gene_type:complete